MSFMTRRPSYFKVGLFIIIAVTLGVVGVIILGSEALFKESVKMETYLDETVQGLEVGSPVKHRGVKIGSVKEIGLAHSYYGIKPSDKEFFTYGKYVLVRMALYPEMFKSSFTSEVDDVLQQMIKDGLRVRLSSQGLTGTAYLEVDYLDPKRNVPLPISWQPEMYYIPSASSTMSKLSASAENVFKKLEDVDIVRVAEHLDKLLVSLNKVVDDSKIAALSDTAAKTISELRETNAQVNKVVTKMNTTMENAKFEKTMTNINQASAELPATINLMKGTITRLDNMVKGKKDDIDEVLVNIRLISENLNELTNSAKKYPSQLIFGEPPKRSEKIK